MNAPRTTNALRRKHRTMLTATACFAFLLTTALTQWPLSLAFRLSHPALERLAGRVAAGEKPPAQWAGVFFVRQTEINRSGVVCLWLDLDPAGYTGFVHCPADSVDGKFAPLWSKRSMDAHWQIVTED